MASLCILCRCTYACEIPKNGHRDTVVSQRKKALRGFLPYVSKIIATNTAMIESRRYNIQMKFLFILSFEKKDNGMRRANCLNVEREFWITITRRYRSWWNCVYSDQRMSDGWHHQRVRQPPISLSLALYVIIHAGWQTHIFSPVSLQLQFLPYL